LAVQNNISDSKLIENSVLKKKNLKDKKKINSLVWRRKVEIVRR